MAISMWKRGGEIAEIHEVPAGEFVAWNTTLWAVTAMNLGGVDLIDAKGGSLGRFLYFSGRDLNFHTKGYRRSPRPREIVWTFAPLAEILRVSARWDDVRTLTVEGPRIPHHR